MVWYAVLCGGVLCCALQSMFEFWASSDRDRRTTRSYQQDDFPVPQVSLASKGAAKLQQSQGPEDFMHKQTKLIGGNHLGSYQRVGPLPISQYQYDIDQTEKGLSWGERDASTVARGWQPEK